MSAQHREDTGYGRWMALMSLVIAPFYPFAGWPGLIYWPVWNLNIWFVLMLLTALAMLVRQFYGLRGGCLLGGVVLYATFLAAGVARLNPFHVHSYEDFFQMVWLSLAFPGRLSLLVCLWLALVALVQLGFYVRHQLRGW